ncbi:asparagine synthase (glutamine-hydrolyzing) [Candidatus Methanophagaceae archaeon]|nr:asparagine synthase (glutamine-hydrolyzing) [Methanophagales archaeon]
MNEMTKEEEEVGSTLRELLSDAVTKTDTDALLLSGGLDTSIIAVLATKAGRNKKAVTVSIAGTPAADQDYAKIQRSRG